MRTGCPIRDLCLLAKRRGEEGKGKGIEAERQHVSHASINLIE